MQIINHSTERYDVVGGINAHWMKMYQRNGGVLDELTLISECYQILFVNYFTSDYTIDVLDEMKEDPKLYRQQSKVNIKQGIETIVKYHTDVLGLFGKTDGNTFISMNEHLYNAFKDDVKKIEAVLETALSEHKHECKLDVHLIVTLNLAYMLIKFANMNLDEMIAKSKAINPVIQQIVWTRQTTLERNLKALSEIHRIPFLAGDIKVYAKWHKFTDKWYDCNFIANNMGCDEKVNEIDASFKEELNEILANEDSLTPSNDKQAKRNVSRIFAGAAQRAV